MEARRPVCDPCRGTALVPYRAGLRAGRGLLRCQGCGAVSASATSSAAEFHSLPRDLATDRLRADAVMRLVDRGRILELGCGPGFFLAQLDPARFATVGLEPDPAMAREASERMRAAGLRGGAMSMDEGARALPAESFEVVALFGTLGRTPSPRAALMETCRLLAPGGLAVIETPCLSSLTARLRGGRWEPLRDPATTWLFSASALVRLATSCGLIPLVRRGSLFAPWPGRGDLLFLARKEGVTLPTGALAELAAASTPPPPLREAH